MSLELDHVQACPSSTAIRQSILGKVPWDDVTNSIARHLGSSGVRIERISPVSRMNSDTIVEVLPVSRSFLQRWREERGETIACLASEADRPARVFSIESLPAESIDFANIVKPAQSGVDLRVGIDSSDDFYALIISPNNGSSFSDADVRQVGDCWRAMGRAADFAIDIRRAQQNMILRLLDSSGTAAIVLDEGGWVKARNSIAQKLLGEAIHLPSASAQHSFVLNSLMPENSKAFTVACTRQSQKMLHTPDGRDLMIYSVQWNRNDVCFPSGDEILVAWDMQSKIASAGAGGEGSPKLLPIALQNTFGLTKKESILASHLVETDLRSAASECGMAYETARSHLKSIFACVNVRRQVELTAILSRFAYHERLRTMLSGPITSPYP